MKSIKHRLLSLLLTLVTILSLLPTAALAASHSGSGLKITTNQAYWSTRLLANGTRTATALRWWTVSSCTAWIADLAITTPPHRT